MQQVYGNREHQYPAVQSVDRTYEIADGIQLTDGMRIIEAACGAGEFSLRLLRRARAENKRITYVGFDSAPDMCARAKRSLVKAGLYTTDETIPVATRGLIVMADFEDRPAMQALVRRFAPHGFDVVICLGTLVDRRALDRFFDTARSVLSFNDGYTRDRNRLIVEFYPGVRGLFYKGFVEFIIDRYPDGRYAVVESAKRHRCAGAIEEAFMAQQCTSLSTQFAHRSGVSSFLVKHDSSVDMEVDDWIDLRTEFEARARRNTVTHGWSEHSDCTTEQISGFSRSLAARRAVLEDMLRLRRTAAMGSDGRLGRDEVVRSRIVLPYPLSIMLGMEFFRPMEPTFS